MNGKTTVTRLIFKSAAALALACGIIGARGRASKPDPTPIAPWASTFASGWANAARAVMLADMSHCEPASALAPTMKHRRWKTIPYELIGGQKGTMIWASPETSAPPERIRLGIKGWHAIYVGVYSGADSPSFAWIKLSSDSAPVPRQNTNTDYYGNVQDAFFKAANLSGDETLQVA